MRDVFDVSLPGPVRQIGYVVRDFDAALESWLAAGIGPWYVIRGLRMKALYRGDPCAVTLSIGLANSGDLQLEVIWQDDATPSIYTSSSLAAVRAFINLLGGQRISTPTCMMLKPRAGRWSGPGEWAAFGSPTSSRGRSRPESSRSLSSPTAYPPLTS